MANRTLAFSLSLLVATCLTTPLRAADPAAEPTPPDRVYVPYEKLKGLLDAQKQGVFVPYDEFHRLWQAAQGSPASAAGAPAAYLMSAARFTGSVGAELATMRLELTIDVLGDDWVQVPLGLGGVAMTKVAFAEDKDNPPKAEPLLRVADGQYVLVTRGKGRRVLQADFVRQLVIEPGKNVLSFRAPGAAISTLDLLIPEENMNVDVQPMLAATTSQADAAGKKATKLMAFLGAGGDVKLSWKPTTQAARDLEPVVIADQVQNVHVGEALITCDVIFNYDIRRQGVDTFTIQLPSADFRVTAVDGANISKWDMVGPTSGPDAATRAQVLQVKLFSPAKDKYTLTVRMERFLQDAQAQIPLMPIVTQSRQALRQTGLIAISHSPRRSVELRDGKGLARVDAGRLAGPANPPPPNAPQQQAQQAAPAAPSIVAYRFITSDYSGTLAIDTVEPRITATHQWALGVDNDRLQLQGTLNYAIERVGVFQLAVSLPDSPVPWEIVSVGPADIVDGHQFSGKGAARVLNILLKREVTGNIALAVVAQAPRSKPDDPVDFALPLADPKSLQLYTGQVVLLLADALRAEVESQPQLSRLALDQAFRPSIGSLALAMAFEFRAIDRAKPIGAKFKVAVKPSQVSAIVHRLVDIQPGWVSQEAIVQFRVLYAPVDTFYLKMPASLADEVVDISGDRIKEKPRLNSPPPDEPTTTQSDAAAPARPWAYYKIVLQSPITGVYQLRVQMRRAFQANPDGRPVIVPVEPLLAAGKLSDQGGYIAIAKADTLSIHEPTVKALTAGDPGSATDLPLEAHRRAAVLAFKYSTPPFELALPVVTQKGADVFTIIANAAIIEQVLGGDGTLNGRAVFLLMTSRADRLPVTLPERAKLYGIQLNGQQASLEAGRTENERLVLLPPTAGQASRVVLEVTYGVDHASPGQLVAPTLPDKVPFQRTVWRVWLPEESRLLRVDRSAQRLEVDEADRLIRTLGADFPCTVAFKLPGQGKAYDFVRQGAPGTLRLFVASRIKFSIVVWLLVILFGVLTLRLSAVTRAFLVLAVVLAGMVVHLFVPLLIGQLAVTAVVAAVLVAGLWAVKWLLLRPRAITAQTEPQPAAAAEALNQLAEGKDAGDAGSKE
ncbi:MAG: hypothetical protein PHU85_12455 [Phycisphaerae bacterium]|nr:hypothetical protein [Phycisphaerae bacterium]